MSDFPPRTTVKQQVVACCQGLSQINSQMDILWRKATNDRLDACYPIVIESIQQQLYAVSDRMKHIAQHL